MDKITFSNKVDTKVTSVAEINKVTGANLNEIKNVANLAVDEILLKTDKGAYNGTSQDLKDAIDSAVFDGVLTYQTVADLPTAPYPAEGTPAKVANDPTDSNNGDWSVFSGAWIQNDTTGLYREVSRNFIHNEPTLNDAILSVDISEGDSINLAERTTGNGGGAMWDVVLSSSVTENGYNIVQCTGVPTLSLVLRVGAEINVKQFGAVGDNVTDDTAAIQSALNSGSLTVDFTNTLMKCDEITIPANVKCINLNLVKKTAGGNLLLVNSGCELIGSIKGTSTVSTVERGVYVAANDVTDVKLSLRVSNFTYGVHGQPISGTAYADAPKRWTGDLSFENIVGTAGASEGYGLLLSPAHNCTLQVTGKTIARHGVYLAAGASYNNINATIDGCQNYAVQTSSQGGQPATEHNIIQILAVNLSENIAGQSGGVALIGNSNYNSLQLNVNSSGTCAFGALIEGTSGGPYPKSNTIQNSVITGNFTGAEVIKVVNCDSTNINNNVIDAYGTFAVISDRTSGTNGSAFASIIEGNSINAQGQAVRGIYEECTAQPSFIGLK